MKDPYGLLVDHDVDVIADEFMRHAVADRLEINEGIMREVAGGGAAPVLAAGG